VPLPLPVAALPDIQLEKTAVGDARQVTGGNWVAKYLITASNHGSVPGSYDLVERFEPGSGIEFSDASVSYNGGETQTGTPQINGETAFPPGEEYCAGPACFPADYVLYTLVEGEQLAAGASESWLVTARFDVDPSELSADQFCEPGGDNFGRGISNIVRGNISVLDPRNINYLLVEDLDDNIACAGLAHPQIPTLAGWMKLLLAGLLTAIAAGFMYRRRAMLAA
jgi:hypothetical protein